MTLMKKLSIVDNQRRLVSGRQIPTICHVALASYPDAQGLG